jgi:hypothetical protein
MLIAEWAFRVWLPMEKAWRTGDVSKGVAGRVRHAIVIGFPARVEQRRG